MSVSNTLALHFNSAQFLNDLLSKFKKNSDGHVAATPYAKQVAESLTQCVKSSEEYLQEECPICLDEPRVEDAVHSKCSSIVK